MNQNEYNYIYLLPNTIIGFILKFLDNDFDKICFILSCKHLFSKSSKLLLFNKENLHPKEFYQTKSLFRLNSFRSNLFDTISFGKSKITCIYKSKLNKIPDNTTHLTIHANCTEIIKPGLIPNTVETLLWNVNQIIGRAVVPAGVKRVTFGGDYNQPTTSLPPGVQKLEFPNSFNQLVIVPKDTKHLRYSISEQEPVTNPSSTTHLHYDRPMFESRLIPKTVINIEFGRRFLQPLMKGQLFSSITHLSFGPLYNQVLEPGVLPDSLLSLLFGTSFNQPIGKDVLPKTLKHLDLGFSYNCPIHEGVLPEGLESIDFGKTYSHPLENLPTTTKFISLPDQYKHSIPNQPIEMIHSGYQILKQIFNQQENDNHTNCKPISRLFLNTFRLHEIEIRIFDKDYSLFLTKSLEGGFIKNESLKDGSFLKTLNL